MGLLYRMGMDGQFSIRAHRLARTNIDTIPEAGAWQGSAQNDGQPRAPVSCASRAVQPTMPPCAAIIARVA
jgi:hypothetical protein